MTARDVVHAFYAAGAAGDLAALMALFDLNAVWDNRIDDNPLGGRFEGLQDIREKLLEPLFEYLPQGIETEVERIISNSGTVVCLNTGRGDTVDGQRFEKRYVHVFDCADGLIVGVTEFRS